MINIFGYKFLLRREKNWYILVLKFENFYLLKEVDIFWYGYYCDCLVVDSRGYWEFFDGFNDWGL